MAVLLNGIFIILRWIGDTGSFSDASLGGRILSNSAVSIIAVGLPVTALFGVRDLVSGVRNKDTGLLLAGCVTLPLCLWIVLIWAYFAITGGHLTALE